MNDNRRKLYDALSEDYELGSFEQFSKDIKDDSKRQKLYDAIKEEYDLPDFAGFSQQLGIVESMSHNTQPAYNGDFTMPESELEGKKPEAQPLNIPSVADVMENRPKFQPKPILEKDVVTDEEGNRVRRPKLQQTMTGGRMSETPVVRDIYGNEYDQTSPETQEMVEEQITPVAPDVKQVNREQVQGLTQSIDSRLNEIAEDVRSNTNPVDYSRYTVQTGGRTLEMNAPGWAELQTAKRSMRDAQRIIDEADHNSQSGTLGKWLESSFAGGAARGFGQKLFDADTWDMGVSDLNDISTLTKALKAYDEGKYLSEEQQMMLDAKAVELATNAYFGSYIGRGYEAGQVTAESIPFMIEMCLNPASAIGEKSGNILARYALRRFAKKAGVKAVEELTEKGLKKSAIETAGKAAVKKAMRPYALAGRALGDVAGSAVMAGTSGIVGVAADTETRMAGDLQFDVDENGYSVFDGRNNEKDFGTAFGESFAARTIENYSEMLGEYFAPALGAVAGKMSKFMPESVTKFINGVSGSDIARMVTDFEKHSKWNGTIGEYAEEVAGGILNSIFVGDQTLDTDENTGVFNLENNIRTSLGVGLMGGVMSGIKTVGYRSPKYRTKQQMADYENYASSVFKNNEKWGQFRDVVATGNDEDIAAVLTEIRNDDSLSEEQKMAAFKYALFAEQYRGTMIAEEKRREEQNPVATDLETSYDNGYTLEGQEMNDAKNNYELQRQKMLGIVTERTLADFDEDPIRELGFIINSPLADSAWTDEERQIALDYVNAKATYDGMMNRVGDDVDSQIAASDAAVDANTNQDDGLIHPAILKEGNRKVYVMRGNIRMTTDGKMIDYNNSDNTLIARDEETGKLIFTAANDYLSVDEPIQPEEEKKVAADAIRQTAQQKIETDINGKLVFNQGDVYTALDVDGNEHKIQIDSQDGNGNVAVFVDDAPGATMMSMAEIQAGVEAYNLARLQQHEEEKQAKREEEKQEQKEQEQGGTEAGEEASLETTGADESPATTSMPITKDGEPDFMAVDPQRTHQFLYNESGMSREDADQFVGANKKAADDALEKAKKEAKKEPKNTAFSKFMAEKKAKQDAVDAAQTAADYWAAVQAEQKKVTDAEAQERLEEAAAVIQQATEEEQARQAEELKKREEQEKLGSNNVGQEIRDKWNAATKIEGAKNEIVLANGEKVAGRYMLVESGAATPSHNARAEFVKNEGFPVTENGQSVNDRDYERDKDAQTITRQIADNYDQRALQSPVVVTNDGVVLSGNGRTMAGELAAAHNTDGAYIEYLAQYGQQYGFTPEQVSSMQHPRVVFVPDEAMPYTAETFSKFNQQEMKGQNKTEQAVKLGKIVDDMTFGRIIRSINKFDTLGDFYADAKAATQAINELLKAGAISQAQYTEMFDGDAISAQGKEMLENMLIGKAFESNPDAVRQITGIKSMRQAIITALAEISNNIALGEYSLEEELSQAIALVYDARKNGNYSFGDKVSGYARQGNLFAFDEGETVADYSNPTTMMLADLINDTKVTRLKKTLSLYNERAKESANGQLDLFTGDVQTKKQIIEDVIKLLNYGTAEQQKSALEGATDKRKSEAGNVVQENGNTGNGNEGNGIDLKREYVKAFLINQFAEGEDLANALTDEEVEKLNKLVDEWEPVNDEYGRIFQEKYNIINHSKDKAEKEKAQKEVDEARNKANEAFKPVDEFINELIGKYEDKLDIPEIFSKPSEKKEENVASQAAYDLPFQELADVEKFMKSIGYNGSLSIVKKNKDGKKYVRFNANGVVAPNIVFGETTPRDILQQFYNYDNVMGVNISADLEEEFEQEKARTKEVNDALWEDDREQIKGILTEAGIPFHDVIDSERGSRIVFTDKKNDNGNYTDWMDVSDIEQAREDIEAIRAKAELYKTQSVATEAQQTAQQPYSITPSEYTTKKGKKLEMHLVKFDKELTKEQKAAAKELAKADKGWWDRERGGFMMRSEESAKNLAETILNDKEAVEEAQPLTVEEVAQVSDKMHESDNRNEAPDGSKWEYEFTYDKETGRCRITRSAVREGVPPIGDGRWRIEANSPEEMQGILENPANGLASVNDVVGAAVHNAIVTRELGGYAKKEEAPAAPESKPEEKPKSDYGANNTMVSAERYEELKARLHKKMFGQLNMGFDPEILAIGTEMAAFHIEAGARSFADFAKRMIADLGDAIRPYLKSFYEGARNFPGMEKIADAMTPYDEVREFDVLSIGKDNKPTLIEVAQEVAQEHEAEQQADEAVEKIKEIAGKGKKTGKNSRKSKKKDVSLQQELDLFGSFGEDATNTEQNGSKNDEGREDKSSSPDVSNGTPKGVERTDNGRLDGNIQEGGNVGEGNRGVSQEPTGNRSGSERPARRIQGVEEQSERPTNPKNTRNNHVERGKDYAPKSVDARIEANIKAIELMKKLVESGEQATPAQMKVLRQFSGWGGLGKAFNPDGVFGSYRKDGIPMQLRTLLGEEAYQQANMSRNSAYYTPAGVIDVMWDIARALGFKGGNVLEGSAGIGSIIGLMPQDMSERSNIHAVEIDQTTGNILKLLYPDADVDIQGFEATQIENGSIDLSITNVPFVTGLRVNDTTGDKDLSKKFHDIHDFCIAKNIRKLREGGIGIFITSSGTLDNSAKLREWIIQEGGSDVVGAFRLNNETFGGTGATSDIIVVRKRVNGKKSPYAIDVLPVVGERTVEYDTGETKKVKGEYVPVKKTLTMDYNGYFVEHPENMAGEMLFGFEKGDTFRPTSKALYPQKGKNQAEMLKAWVESLADKDWEAEPQGMSAEEFLKTLKGFVGEELGEGVKEGSMLIDKNGRLCIAQRGKAIPLSTNDNKVKGHTKEQCFQSYKRIKDALSELLDYQTKNDNDEGLQPLLKALNKAYDEFVKTYGHLHKNTSISFLKNDVDFANILALEKFSERPDVSGKRIQEYGKTDIFSRRVVEKEREPEPNNVKDAIIASIYVNGRIDLPWIASKLSNKTDAEIKREIIESGLGFEDPVSRQMEVSYEYLSGNVREKLRQAQENNTDGRYDTNIKALESVIPITIPAHLIDFNIGSSWIDPKLYEDYVREKTDIDVSFTSVGGTWYMDTPKYIHEEKNKAFGVRSDILQKIILGTTLIEAAMQNRTIEVKEVRKEFGETKTITDKEATQACANKIDEIRQDFKDWARARMQSDAALRENIESTYNEIFNNFVPKSIPDEFVPEHFGGAAKVVDGKPFALRPHQGKAVVRGTTQPLLLAHEVGTGKTYTLISIAMEMRRLGTARKPMIVVQNATVGQFVESAKKLYPNAKVLTLDEKDHTGDGRKNFYAKIKYNDWDMIVVPQSVFERIPDSEERQIKFIKDKIQEKLAALDLMKDADPNSKSLIVRNAESEIEKLEDELAAITEAANSKHKDDKKREVAIQNAGVRAAEMLDRETDDVENFDDMGIDAILVDEAHEYKHLGFATAMQRGVKGVDPSYSKKAQGVYLKAQAVLEKNNGRNVIFATGTPISNTAAEIWTFMRYLMPADTLKDYGIFYFDDFVRNFGNLQQMLEFTTSGKFKENNRFAGYVNLPELVRIWSGIADTVLTREAGGVSDKIPAMEGDKATDIYLPQTRALRSIMKYVKEELERFDKMSGKEKKENSHIPLTMYGIAKAAAVDARLVVVDAADEPQSKTNEAVRQTLRTLKETESYNGTVALFADNYQNKKSGFNLYEDIRKKLIDAGVPAEQIVVMKSGMSVKKKLEIFDAVNRGEIRVIMGSTFTLGTGVNIQERLHTLIHLDAPNRPMDYTQRNGRILRQGNLHKEMGKPVRILRFGVEDSLDVTAYQRLKTKGAIADSIMNGKQMMANSMENRALEEEEDVFGDTVAQLSGSEYAMLKNQAEKDVRKYEAKKKQWQADQIYCHSEIPRLEKEISEWKKIIDKYRQSLSKVEALSEPITIKVGKKTFSSVEEMADFIKEYNKEIREAENKLREKFSIDSETHNLTVNIGGIDFVFTTELSAETGRDQGMLFTTIRRRMTYSCKELGLEDLSVFQSLLREGLETIMSNIISGKSFKEVIERGERSIASDEKSLSHVRERYGKPFELEDELKKAHEHFDEYAELMKKELEEKEKKYADMDADIEEATGVVEAEEAEEENDEVKEQRAEGEVELPSEQERVMRDALVEFMQGNGLDVVMDESAQQFVDDLNTKQQRAYHGSGADFDAFDHSFIGTGANSQSFGWGTYLSDNMKVAEGYMYMPGDIKFYHNGTEIETTDTPMRMAAAIMTDEYIKDEEEAVEHAEKMKSVEASNKNVNPERQNIWDNVIAILKSSQKSDFSRTERTPTMYTVEIPDNTGDNYLTWTKTIDKPLRRRIAEVVRGLEGQPAESVKYTKYANGWDSLADMIERNQWAYMEIRDRIVQALGGRLKDEKRLSELMHDAGFVGVEYPAGTIMGNGYGATNYVIFDESDLKITSKERFFRTKNGSVYGFTKDGKIYIDPRIATAETPIHEYTHLWAEALRKANPEAWEKLKQEMLGQQDVMDYVKKLYPELEGDALIEEVFAHYAGKRGAERLRSEMQAEMANAGSLLDKAMVVAMFEKIRKVLKKFWNTARDLFAGNNDNLSNTTAEDFADMMMADLIGGFVPKTPDGGGKASHKNSDIQKIESKYEALSKRYNGKPYFIVIDIEGLSDEEFVKALGIDFGEVENMSQEELKNEVKKVRDDAINRKVSGSYSPETRKIVIFAENISDPSKTEEAFFHENIHGILHDWYENSLRTIAERFHQDAPKHGFFVEWDWVNEKYKEKPINERKEEFFVYSLSRAMVEGRIEEVLEWFDEEDGIRIDNILKTIGYDRRAEETQRRAERAETKADSKGDLGQNDERLILGNVDEDGVLHRLRDEEPPTKTGIGYKVFVLKDGKLYPPMVANPNGEATPVGVWLNADAAPIAGTSKTGRAQVKAGGKGTQGGSGTLSYRPGWHLGEIPYASQFNRINPETGERELFPKNFVWAEVEYADDVDYQEEAMSYGYNKNGKFQHSYAGLPRVPENGSYRYRTNPNPETDPWIITGAMKVKRLLKPSEVDEMVKAAGRQPQPRQEGAVTDAEIEEMNDKIAIIERDGEEGATTSERRNGYSKKQYEAYKKREWKRMVDAANNAISKLNLEGAVEIKETPEGLSGKDARAKGFFNPRTGKITIILSNNRSAADVLKTILHEGVAHYGLRKLFGEHFDTFLDNVYREADDSIRKEIARLAVSKYNMNFRRATEEYMARLAEDTDFDNAEKSGLWQTIKKAFVVMLNFIHKPMYEGFSEAFGGISDNDLRYLLWRSYKNLESPGMYRSLIETAQDVAMRTHLGISSNYSTEETEYEQAAESDNLHRDADDVEISPRDRSVAKQAYEKAMSSGLNQFVEATQDSMLGLKELMRAIVGKGVHIEDIAGNENAYLAENRMSSTNAAEQHDYYLNYMKPLLEEVGRLVGSNEEARQALTDYMMAKHGLERNEKFAARDAKIAEENGEDYDEAYTRYRGKDYSGLTALTGEEDVEAAESAAQQMVDSYEAEHNTSDLWNLIRFATQASLGKLFRSGLLSQERYDSIRDMFDYYIPLQGWDETTSDEVYGYLTSKTGPFGSPIKHAVGRSSKADDPMATIVLMADQCIMKGNRNQMKQRFLNFVMDNPSDLVSVSELWLQHDDVTDEWNPVFADIDANDTGEEVERKIAAFEEKMQQLAEADPDKYKRGSDTKNIPYKVVKGNLKEHQVLVQRAGRTWVLTINGNPRAAQALNGLTNPDVNIEGVVGNMMKAAETINHKLSAFYTTRNPDFVVSNFFRDMLYSNCMTWVKESPAYALKFHKNFGKYNPAMMRRLLGKWEDGTLDKNDYTERMFYEFMMNGGETGYTSVRDIEAHKKEIADELELMAKPEGVWESVKIPVKKAWQPLALQLDLLNRSVENCARFAAFLTSREIGRTIDRSIYDAKEVSVNFNKKGAGGKMVNAVGQTFMGKVGSYVGGGGRMMYVFWNAGVQGMTNFGRAARRHPAKAFAGASVLYMLGYLIPIAAAAGGGDDDDKNAYYNLPEYIRRTNICINIGDKWITIPLPIEFRGIYGLGELASGLMSGKEHYGDKELAFQIASQVSQILPLDILEGGGGAHAFVPSGIKPFTEAYILNKSWSGLPIYKDTPWNKQDPEWTKAYKNTDKTLVDISEWLNEETGGNEFKKGAIDINPAKIEYFFNGMFGGYMNTAEKLKKMGETAFGDREFDWRNMLIANRLIKTGDERTENRKLQNEYFKYKDEYEETKRLVRKYENAADEGNEKMNKNLDALTKTKEYLRYEIFDEYVGDIKELEEELKEVADEKERKEIEAEKFAVMRELINHLHEIDKQD